MTKKKIEEITPKLQVEALLFSSGRTMSEDQLAGLTKLDVRTVRKALSDLEAEYTERHGAVVIYNDPTGWKMMVRDSYVPTVKNIVADTELSRACMETLAVIAYKYPKVKQSEVIAIRGSGAYEHMAELEKLGFITREPSGRSYNVKLSEKFFSYFEVSGGRDIREVFKNVKVPEKVVAAAQKTLGDLEVVDSQLPATEQQTPQESPVEIVDVEEPEDNHHAFLSDLDERIARVQQRNDETDKDPAFQRKQLPGMEVHEELQDKEEAAEEEHSKEDDDQENEEGKEKQE